MPPLSQSPRQRGGTLLGLILGLILGLGAALGVALFVAKVPVPFIHKASSRSSEQDAAEAERNRNWNPNAPLQGRSASGTVSPAPAAKPETGIRPLPMPAEVPEQTQQDNRRTSSDPLGDFIAARTARTQAAPPSAQPAAPAPAQDAAEPFLYFVQAGAFRDPNEAEAQRARLLLAGIQARVTSHEQAGRTVYRVRTGPFQKKEWADDAKARMLGGGFDAALVRVQR